MADESPTLPQRLAKPGEAFEYVDGPRRRLHTLEADDEGHIQPPDAAADTLLEQRGLPRLEADPDGPSYKQLQKRARKLDIPASGTKAELSAAIEAREAELASASPNDEPDGDDEEAT